MALAVLPLIDRRGVGLLVLQSLMDCWQLAEARGGSNLYAILNTRSFEYRSHWGSLITGPGRGR